MLPAWRIDERTAQVLDLEVTLRGDAGEKSGHTVSRRTTAPDLYAAGNDRRLPGSGSITVPPVDGWVPNWRKLASATTGPGSANRSVG